ncbi:THAP domain-containing protein 3 isoform X3 [Equus przewalskii]|uniref:THAP domain-containing protein 3 isoform X3 n=1 Tax=Equus przewalskii TaxID=9798 RepID=A0ABM4N4G3_EQUPR
MPRRPAGPAPPAGPAAAIFVRGGRAWRVEMPKSCAARQCCNRYSNRRKQLTFHRFPFSRPELLKEWVLNIGRGNFKPKQHTVICSEHFRPECFSAFGNRKNLKHNAVPTEFAFQEPAQLVKESTAPDSQCGNVDSEEVVSRVGAGERGPGRKADTALEALQLPPSARRPGEQVLPHRPEATKAPSQPASPTGLRRALPAQPSDHSYALLDLNALKKKLFLTLKENEKLRKRLKAQRLVMRRMSSRLRAHRAGQAGLQGTPEQQS